MQRRRGVRHQTPMQISDVFVDVPKLFFDGIAFVEVRWMLIGFPARLRLKSDPESLQ